MQVFDARAEQEAFVEELSQARESVLVLDYDGTLAPFHVERDRGPFCESRIFPAQPLSAARHLPEAPVANGTSSPARKLRLVAGTIGNLHRFAGLDRAIRPSGMH